LSNHNIYDSNDGTIQNGSSALSRREAREKSITGELPMPGTLEIERNVTPGMYDYEQMILSLQELFEHDRQVASHQDATRCGICYLHFRVHELHYREEGFYICSKCDSSLGNQRLPMVRKQQKL
jgi:hypothetical protein